jgi:hypothetical protein
MATRLSKSTFTGKSSAATPTTGAAITENKAICHDAHVLNDCPYRFNVRRFQPVYSLEGEEAAHQHAATQQEYQYPPQ